VSSTTDLCYRMPFVRRARGAILRLVRRRGVAIVVGVLLIAPAAWVELWARDVSWWQEGLALIAGATGVALVWTGLTGTRPDWIEP